MVKSLPVRSVIEAIAGAATAWCEPSFEPRCLALEAVCRRTGYSAPVVKYAFDSLFGSLTREAIESAIATELGSLEVLDGFVARGPRYSVRALPLGHICVISSRTTIGVAIVPAIFALCAKCDVLVKDRDDRLVSAFFATLAQRQPALSESAVARPWAGNSDAVALSAFDAVVAFGSHETLSAIAGATAFPTQLIGHPTKLSAGYLTRDWLSSEAMATNIARAAARDMLLYDGEGCLSLRALFVEREGAITPAQFTSMLATALEDTEAELPTPLRAHSAAQRALAADAATFATTAAGAVLTDERRNFLLQLDPSQETPPLLLPRTLSIYAVDGPADAFAFFERHRIPLEALAVAGTQLRLREIAARLRVARITTFGSLQAPPLATPHGGRPRIAEFVRWLVDET